jgi:tetratricopeptide (TPR) repeat protein
MVKARYMQAVVERELGETDKAIASASEVIRDDGNHDKAHLLLGLLYHESERFDKALIHFETALQLAPTAASREQAQAWVTSTARRNDAP